jgi:hypothetical protein
VAGSLSPEAKEVVVGELTAVVKMDVPDCEGQLSENVGEGIDHDQAAAAQDSAAFTPDGGHIDHLEGMHILTLGVEARVVHQVCLAVAS